VNFQLISEDFDLLHLPLQSSENKAFKPGSCEPSPEEKESHPQTERGRTKKVKITKRRSAHILGKRLHSDSNAINVSHS
jgi:hypothetical protein